MKLREFQRVVIMKSKYTNNGYNLLTLLALILTVSTTPLLMGANSPNQTTSNIIRELNYEDLFRLALKTSLEDTEKERSFFKVLMHDGLSREDVCNRIAEGVLEHVCINFVDSEWDFNCGTIFEIEERGRKLVFMEFAKWNDGPITTGPGFDTMKYIFEVIDNNIVYLGVCFGRIVGIEIIESDLQLTYYFGASFKSMKIVKISNNKIEVVRSLGSWDTRGNDNPEFYERLRDKDDQKTINKVEIGYSSQSGH
jgi:hypothetical protein